MEGVRTVSYDQPGHGRSGRLDKGEYTLEMLASALRKVIDECAVPGAPVVLIGHSMGASVAQRVPTCNTDARAPGR